MCVTCQVDAVGLLVGMAEHDTFSSCQHNKNWPFGGEERFTGRVLWRELALRSVGGTNKKGTSAVLLGGSPHRLIVLAAQGL